MTKGKIYVLVPFEVEYEPSQRDELVHDLQDICGALSSTGEVFVEMGTPTKVSIRNALKSLENKQAT